MSSRASSSSTRLAHGGLRFIDEDAIFSQVNRDRRLSLPTSEHMASTCPSATMTVPCCSRASSTCSCSGTSTPCSTTSAAGNHELSFASKLTNALRTMVPPPDEDDLPASPARDMRDLPSREKHRYMAECFKYSRAMAMREHTCDSVCSSTDCSYVSSLQTSRNTSFVSSRDAYGETYEADEEGDYESSSMEEEEADAGWTTYENSSFLQLPSTFSDDTFNFDMPGAPFLPSEPFPPSNLPDLDLPSHLLNFSAIIELSSSDEEDIGQDDASPEVAEGLIPSIKINGVDYDETIHGTGDEETESIISDTPEDENYLCVAPRSYTNRSPQTTPVIIQMNFKPSSEPTQRQLPLDLDAAEAALVQAIMDNNLRKVVKELMQGGLSDLLRSAAESLNELD